jgi:hypothetical protein
MRALRRWLPVALLAGWAGGANGQDRGPDPPAAAPERHVLAHRVEAGQVLTVEQLTTKVLRYRFRGVRGGEGPDREVPAEVEHVERRLHTDSILAAAEGRPLRIERHVHAHTSASVIQPGGQRTAEQKALHGRTLRLTRASDDPAAEWSVATAAGEPLPGASAEHPPVPALVAFLPRAPVAVGEAWAIDRGALRTVLGGPAEALEVREGRATLAAVVPDGPRRLARVEVRVAWSAPHERLFVVEADLAGPLVVDLTSRRLVRGDLAGTLRITTRPEARSEGVAETTVQGTLAMRWRVTEGAPAPEAANSGDGNAPTGGGRGGRRP